MVNPFDFVQFSQVLNRLPDPVELALKKLSKKDLNTKLKGLDELSSYFGATVFEDWDGFWQRFLPLLQKGLLDAERRVRMGYALLLHAFDRSSLPRLDPKFQYAIIGALNDPLPSVRSTLASIVPGGFLDAHWSSIQTEALDWLRIKADKLYQGLVKDCESVQNSAEKEAALATALSSRHLALHRAISVLSCIPTDSLENIEEINTFLSNSIRFPDQPPAIRNALLSFYLNHKVPLGAATMSLLMKEASPKVIPSIVRIVPALQGVEILYNIFNCSPFDLVDEIVAKLLPENSYKGLLLPACYRFNVIYDERKIKFMFTVISHFLSRHPQKDVLLPDFFVRAVINGEAPFGVYGMGDALAFFPSSFPRSYFLSSWPINLSVKRQARLFELSIQRFPIDAREKFRSLGTKINVQLLKLVPSLLPEYLSDTLQLQADLLADPTGVISLLPSLECVEPCSKGTYEAVLDHKPSLLCNSSMATWKLLMHHFSSNRLFSTACQIESLELALLCCSDVSFNAPMPELVPPLWFKDAAFCRAILKNRHYPMVGSIDNNLLGSLIEEHYLGEPDVSYTALLELQHHLANFELSTSNLDVPCLPPASHPDAWLLPDIGEAATKVDSNRLAKLVILSSHLTNDGQSKLLSPCRLFLEEECCISLPIAPCCVYSDELFEASAKHGNFYSLGLERAPIPLQMLTEQVDPLSGHIHHQIVVCSAWSRLFPKAALQRLRDAIFSYLGQQDEPLVVWSLAIARTGMSVTSDIILGLLELDPQMPFVQLGLLKMLSTSNFPLDFLNSYLRQLSFVVHDNLRNGRGRWRDLALDCISSYQLLQTEPEMHFIMEAFKSSTSPSASLIRCARIGFASEPFDQQLIVRLMDVRPEVRESTFIQALLMSRFLFVLGHDMLVTEIGAKQQVPFWLSDLFVEGQYSHSAVVRNFMAWEMALGLAESCRGGNARDDSIALDRIQVFLNERIDYAIRHIFADSSLEPCDWTFYDIEALSPSSDLGPWAGHLLYRSLRCMPALFSAYRDEESLGKIFQNACMLIQKNQLAKLRNSRQEGIKVASSSTQTDVYCEYQFEDATLNLHIRLPPNFPLQSPDISIPKSSKLTSTKTKHALLAAKSLLLQRCDLLESLKCWRASLDASFAGTEPCSICYCVMCPHDGGKALPGPSCRTCHHKFHPYCLYKWFKSSGKSTCPICRSLF